MTFQGCSIFPQEVRIVVWAAGAPIEFADGGPFVELFLAWKHPRTRKRRTKIIALGNEQLAVGDLSVGIVPKAAESAPDSSSGNNHATGQSLKQASREASRRAEREMILKQLERTHWNRKKTARDLQISYKALLYKLKQLGLDGSGMETGNEENSDEQENSSYCGDCAYQHGNGERGAARQEK